MNEPGLQPSSSLRPPTRAVRMVYDDVSVEGMSVELPPITLPTAELEDRLRPLYRKLGFKPGWVEAVTGIQSRRAWAPGERYLDGAVRAARRAMAEGGIDPRCVQAVVSCSVYKDRLEPSLACEIQGALGIPHTAINFDVSNACLGFLTGMTLVANMIRLGQIDAGLVVSAEDSGPVLQATIDTLSQPSADIHAFKANLATLTLGSCATAVVLSRNSLTGSRHRFLGGTSITATEHAGLCMGDARGMHTDSVALLREGVALAGRTWAELKDTLGWTGPEVGTYALHQVGKAHHEAILRHLGVPFEQAPTVFSWLGNIGSCGVPATSILARDQGRLRPGDTLAMLGIGSGLSCTMMGVRW